MRFFTLFGRQAGRAAVFVCVCPLPNLRSMFNELSIGKGVQRINHSFSRPPFIEKSTTTVGTRRENAMAGFRAVCAVTSDLQLPVEIWGMILEEACNPVTEQEILCHIKSIGR